MQLYLCVYHMRLACHDFCVTVKRRCHLNEQHGYDLIPFAAVVITLIIYIGSFAAMLHEYGSIEGILKEYQNLTGIDYNELLQQMDTAK